MLLIKQKILIITFYKVNFSPHYLHVHVHCKVKFQTEYISQKRRVQLLDEREKSPSPYYGTLHYNNKSGFSLLIKALELPVPLSDPFAETFNTH